MNLSEISLACFVEFIDDENRHKYEMAYMDEDTGVTITPVFVTTGR
jgi:hypothetical protein